MEDFNFDDAKQAVLRYIEDIFAEREHEIAVSHQEKFAMLEDVLDNAVDVSELRVAFEQWHAEHADDIDLEDDAGTIWDQALAEYNEM